MYGTNYLNLLTLVHYRCLCEMCISWIYLAVCIYNLIMFYLFVGQLSVHRALLSCLLTEKDDERRSANTHCRRRHVNTRYRHMNAHCTLPSHLLWPYDGNQWTHHTVILSHAEITLPRWPPTSPKLDIVISTGAALLENKEATAKSTSQDGGMAVNFG